MLLKNYLWLILTKPVLWSKVHTVHLIAWNQNIRGLHKVSPFVSVTLFLKSVVQVYGNGQRKKYLRGIKGHTKDREIKIKSEECQEMGICRGYFLELEHFYYTFRGSIEFFHMGVVTLCVWKITYTSPLGVHYSLIMTHLWFLCLVAFFIDTTFSKLNIASKLNTVRSWECSFYKLKLIIFPKNNYKMPFNILELIVGCHKVLCFKSVSEMLQEISSLSSKIKCKSSHSPPHLKLCLHFFTEDFHHWNYSSHARLFSLHVTKETQRRGKRKN